MDKRPSAIFILASKKHAKTCMFLRALKTICVLHIKTRLLYTYTKTLKKRAVLQWF